MQISGLVQALEVLLIYIWRRDILQVQLELTLFFFRLQALAACLLNTAGVGGTDDVLGFQDHFYWLQSLILLFFFLLIDHDLIPELHQLFYACVSGKPHWCVLVLRSISGQELGTVLSRVGAIRADLLG